MFQGADIGACRGPCQGDVSMLLLREPIEAEVQQRAVDLAECQLICEKGKEGAN